MPVDQAIPHHQHVHIGAQETGDGFAGQSHHGFVFVERGVQDDGDPGLYDNLEIRAWYFGLVFLVSRVE